MKKPQFENLLYFMTNPTSSSDAYRIALARLDYQKLIEWVDYLENKLKQSE